MRTPVILVAGQADSGQVTGALLQRPGTIVVEHQFDGHVVCRSTAMLKQGVLCITEEPIELARGCLSCTIRDDLLILLRKLHRRSDVNRIVVRMEPWLEPEPICAAIQYVRVGVDPDLPFVPAAHDVAIAGVVTCVDSDEWLIQALGDRELPDGRTVAQVVVDQAEFADVLVLSHPDPQTLAVLKRLAPRSRITVGAERVELALNHLDACSPRGCSADPHGPLLSGAPPLHDDGEVRLVEFTARRPFHPVRLHDAIDLLLEGVIRARGRLWLSSRTDHVMWLESAGGGLHVSNAGKWLAAMTPSEIAYVSKERQAFGNLMWLDDYGDRHTSMSVLLCGAQPAALLDGLSAALLTDDEMAATSDWHHHHDPFGDWHKEPCTDHSDTANLALGPTDQSGRDDGE